MKTTYPVNLENATKQTKGNIFLKIDSTKKQVKQLKTRQKTNPQTKYREKQTLVR